MSVLPTTYKSISDEISPINKSQICSTLTKEFVAGRLKVYEDKRNSETKKFIQLYGEQHLNNIIFWLNKAAKELVQRK